MYHNIIVLLYPNKAIWRLKWIIPKKNMVVFRDSRKGYDKNDVNCYIENMNIRFTEKEAALKAQLRKTEEALESLRDRQNKCAVLEQEITELKQRLENASFDKTQPQADEAEDDIPVIFPEISAKLGSILIKANLDADKIISEAEAEAQKQLSEAAKCADGIKLDAAVAARVMTERVKAKLSALTEDYINQLSAFSDDSVREYRRLYIELKAKFNELGMRSDDILNEFNIK